ncbi:MAG: sugar-binding domain-containing protein [Limisphaerales bacterium]
MRQKLLTCLIVAGAGFVNAAPLYTPPVNPRMDINLNSGWRFIRQDVTGAQNLGFDDSSWTNLNLPHTWNNLDGQRGGEAYYRGIGWYRTHYTVSKDFLGRRCFLKFEGASSVADVYVNGNFVGAHEGRILGVCLRRYSLS